MKRRKRCMKQVKNTHETVQEVYEAVRNGAATLLVKTPGFLCSIGSSCGKLNDQGAAFGQVLDR